jgi:hypothetical protein
MKQKGIVTDMKPSSQKSTVMKHKIPLVELRIFNVVYYFIWSAILTSYKEAYVKCDNRETSLM